LEGLIAFLNSKLFEWYFKKIMFIEVEGGGIQMFNTVMEKIPIPQIKEDYKYDLIKLIKDMIDMIKKNSKDRICILDKLINDFVYNTIGLCKDEIEFIEAN
jgi:hypothetical protein